jgi:Domain of unknown function (DUF4352)
MLTNYPFFMRNTRQSKWVMHIVGLLFILAMATPVSTAQAESACADAPERCVSYLFRTYWQNNDGLRTFGRAIGGSTVHFLPGNTTYYTQAFERTVLEYFPGRGDAQYRRVAVGQLWYDTFRDQLQPVTADALPGTCSVVAEQHPEVCGAILAYYHANGLQLDASLYVTPTERRSLFGMPITPVMQWSHNGQTRLVQVFTHARIDYTVDATGTEYVGLGDVVVDLLNANVALPTTPSAPINLLYSSEGPLLDRNTLDSHRTAMPQTGYWQSTSDGVYIATSSFGYLDYFYTVWAGKGQKYVTLTLLVKNARTQDQAPVYLDYSYVGLIDSDGMRYAPSEMTKYLATPFTPTTITPGSSVAGQLVFVVPTHAAPAQVEIQLANMDQYISRFVQVIELRVPALQ